MIALNDCILVQINYADEMNTKQLINLILKLWDRMGTPRV